MKKYLLATITLLAFASAQRVHAASAIASVFDGAAIPAGKKIWFAAVVKINNAATYPLAVYFTRQTISSSAFSLSVPDAALILDPTVTTATTVFNGATWVTTAPPNQSGYYFISGTSDSLVSPIPGSLAPVSWTGTFSASRSGILISWQWAAAAYSSFNADMSVLGIKASDCGACSGYPGADHAGTPERYRTFVTAGAGGAGGSDFTGSFTAASFVYPAVADFDTAICAGASMSLFAAAASGAWTSSNPSVATVASNGTVTGVSSGEAVISFCATYPLTTTTTVTVNGSPSITGTVTPVSCNGYTDGSIDISVSGYSWIYSCSWSNGSSLSAGAWGLAAGTYSVTATYPNGCSASAAYTVAQPAPLTGAATVTNAYGSLHNGAVNFSVSGGTGPYNYSWYNTTTGFAASTQSISALPWGEYCVAVTDQHACAYNNCYNVTCDCGKELLGGPAQSNATGLTEQATAYPNPFTSSTKIVFSAPDDGHITVTVYNAISGKQAGTIFDGYVHAGTENSCVFDGAGQSAGLYLYRISTADNYWTGKIMLAR